MTHWIRHFKSRKRDVPRALVTPVYHLSMAEEKRIASSIAEFERGESSEALDFRMKNAQYAKAQGNPGFEQAAHLFIQEENFHSRLLATYMDQHNLPPIEASAADSIFRWLRSRTEVAWSSRVLITAEVIAQVYYPALRDATDDPQLQAICDRIIDDEAFHIAFQTDRIREVEATLSWTCTTVHKLLHPILFLGAAVVVWMRHRPVLAHSLNF